MHEKLSQRKQKKNSYYHLRKCETNHVEYCLLSKITCSSNFNIIIAKISSTTFKGVGLCVCGETQSWTLIRSGSLGNDATVFKSYKSLSLNGAATNIHTKVGWWKRHSKLLSNQRHIFCGQLNGWLDELYLWS